MIQPIRREHETAAVAAPVLQRNHRRSDPCHQRFKLIREQCERRHLLRPENDLYVLDLAIPVQLDVGRLAHAVSLQIRLQIVKRFHRRIAHVQHRFPIGGAPNKQNRRREMQRRFVKR